MTGADTTDQLATVRRTYEYRLYPRPGQARALDEQQRRRVWRDYGVSVGFREQSAQLTEARRELPWLQGMNALAQHEMLRRLYGRRSARNRAEMALWCAEHDAGPGTV
ncbi:MAG TPA: hypothetical protein VGO80_03630 [Solirubrobacteraceae bacterium]|nr:hypothetical protein [Solirubrobacteraceae bacterium]